MASQLSWNQRPLEVCVLKTWLRLPVLVHFRKQQRNISNILVVSASASTNSHLSKSYLCFKGDLRRNNQHFYTQRKSTESEFVFAQREAPSWTSEKIPVFCFKYEFPVLYFRLCRLFVRFLDGKRICSLLRSFIHLSLDFFAVLHVSLCSRGKINLI